MRTFAQLTVLAWIGATGLSASAHEIWIDAATFRPEPGASVEVVIASGHYFPASEVVVKDDVLALAEMRTPVVTGAVVTAVRGKKRVGTIVAKSAGPVLLRAVLKQPRAPQPASEAKAILVCGGVDDAAFYAVGSGLELVPEAAVSSLRPGAAMDVRLLLDGKPIAGALHAVSESGGSDYLRTTETAPARVPLLKPGRYLVTAEADGRACSLVFVVSPEPP
jgi:hypothetical protein